MRLHSASSALSMRTTSRPLKFGDHKGETYQKATEASPQYFFLVRAEVETRDPSVVVFVVGEAPLHRGLEGKGIDEASLWGEVLCYPSFAGPDEEVRRVREVQQERIERVRAAEDVSRVRGHHEAADERCPV